MKKINEEIKKVIKNIKGKLIYIGNVKEEISKEIEYNKDIIYCDILGSTEGTGFGKKKKGKSLNMKDFKKYYKKKRIDYMICDINDIKKHIPKFISTSIYICNNSICIYGNKEVYDLETICKKYKRYNTNIKITEYLNDYIIEINVSSAKNKFIMDKLYYIIDVLGMIADKISDLIMN